MLHGQSTGKTILAMPKTQACYILRHNLSQANVAQVVQHKLRTDTFPMFLGFGLFCLGSTADITTSRLF